MRKRCLRILLTLALSLFLFPTFVQAEESPTPITKLYVNGVDVLANPNTDGWTFDPATGTLTLHDIEITNGYEPEDTPGTYVGIYAEGDLNLVAGYAPGNLISLQKPEAECVYGIQVAGHLKITGFEVRIKNCSASEEFYGIAALGDVSIDKANVTIESNHANSVSIGIFSFGQLTIQNCRTFSINAHDTDFTIGLFGYQEITLKNNSKLLIDTSYLGIFSTLNLHVIDTALSVSGDSIGIMAYAGMNLDHQKYTAVGTTDHMSVKGTSLRASGNDMALVVYEGGTFDKDGDFIADGTFIQMKEPLYLWLPDEGELVTLIDDNGDSYQVVVDSKGNPATSVGVTPKTYSVRFDQLVMPDISTSLPVVSGYSINDMYPNFDFTPVEKEGCTFYGWFTNRACTVEYEFPLDQPVTKNLYLYPKWTKTGVCPGLADCPSIAFNDLNRNLWYHEYIDYVVEHQLMQGVSATRFDPEAPTTRAMLVTILWRLEGSPKVDYDMTFTDLEKGRWYVEAVRWAASEGIVQGYNDLKFGPNDNLERQQIATILFRHAASKGYDVSFSEAAINGFTDAASISNYAKEAMAWGSDSGLLKGYTDGTVQPAKSATRAEIATFLYRFIALQDAQ